MAGERAAAAARPWSAASSFWGRPGAEAPAAHFRTSAHAGDVLAGALLVLLLDIDERLGRPSRLDVVDVGAGDGGLLDALLRRVPEPLAPRLALTGIDLLPRPAALDARIGWVQGSAPDAVPTDVRGLLLAHEWLDELPVDVVEVDGAGTARLVLVDDDGAGWSALGLDAGAARDWLARWWPVAQPGARAETGLHRDLGWARLCDRLAAGTALGVDYGHDAQQRPMLAGGTLAAYLGGRRVPPRPDGSVNLTAHVAVDSCAAAVPGTTITDQRTAVTALGVSAALPPTSLARTAPTEYADALERASLAAELLDPAGLGGFTWLRLDR